MERNNLGIRIEDDVLKGKDVPYTAKNTNLGKAVLETLENDEDFVGLVDPVTDEKYTYRTMRERSVRCALWMREQGLQPGDVVTICSERNLDTGLVCFASLYIGAIFNPLNPGMRASNFSRLLNKFRPKMVFADEDSASTVAEAAKGVNLDVKIVVFGRVPGFLEYETVIAGPTEEDAENFKVDRIGSPDETAFIVCSSGTTGLPKGVALSHKTYLWELNSPEAERMAGMACIAFSSTYWITGTWIIFFSLFRKMTNIVAPAFEEYSACAIIEKYKVNLIVLSSIMINRWLKTDALYRCDLSTLKIVITGGYPLPSGTRDALTKCLPHTMISVAYGATETGGPNVSRTIQSKQKPGSSGHILDNVQIKVIDPVTRRLCGANTKGEIILKVPTMLNSYYNDPQATADAVDEEGWLHTGDLGYYDEEGNIFIVDRLKEIMKYRGYHVSPAEIENVLLSHPAVKDAVVVGLPHPDDGQNPIAFVVRTTDAFSTGKEVTETELIDLVVSELSDPERLRGGVRFIDSLPKTDSGKFQRRAVQEMANSMVNNQGR